jgi:hypothetical protein
MTDRLEYTFQEAPPIYLFTPDAWLRMSKLSPKISVRLFDAALPEDGPLPKCAAPLAQQP